MREIKFRAWDTKKKKWIEGAYGFHILGESMLIGGLFQDYKLEQLNDIILMQYTGLKDKNGVEIYEGDILREKCIKDLIFTMEHGEVGWMLVRDNQYITAKYSEQCEVIGNIWENKELLK